VLVPMAFLASRPISDSLTVRLLVLALFTSGLVALLGYIGWIAVLLRRIPS